MLQAESGQHECKQAPPGVKFCSNTCLAMDLQKLSNILEKLSLEMLLMRRLSLAAQGCLGVWRTDPPLLPLLTIVVEHTSANQSSC
jgi:hypothetical protein